VLPATALDPDVPASFIEPPEFPMELGVVEPSLPHAIARQVAAKVAE